MDFKYVSVFSTEELMSLKKEVEEVLNTRRGEEAQKIWDNIMTNFHTLMNMDVKDTMITNNDTLDDLYYQLSSRPEWEFNNDD